MTFHPTLFQVRYAEINTDPIIENKEYGTLLYRFNAWREKPFPNCPERNQYFTYEIPSLPDVDFDEVSYFVILNIPPMKRTDTVKITMFGDSNTNKGKLDLNPSHGILLLRGYPPSHLRTEKRR